MYYVNGQLWFFDCSPLEKMRSYAEPKNEEERLCNLQKEFRITKDASYVWNMESDIKHIALRCATKITGGQSKEYKTEIADKAALVIITRILRYSEIKPGWFIKNFKTYIYREVRHWICKGLDDAMSHLDPGPVKDTTGGNE